jgi:hypothetical protein
VEDVECFTGFLRTVVRSRIRDTESRFEIELRALATTGMDTEFIGRLLESVPEPEPWELGEALAECTLLAEVDCKIHWPWNTVRDRRTPRASLPGTDLIGFCTEADGARLLFGEVKTSSQKRYPPKVMSGGSGMTWQLENSAKTLAVQFSLLHWLHARCTTDEARALYTEAVGRFIRSGGTELTLVGVLVRDTNPNEADLQGRAKKLSRGLDQATRVRLFAWYLPVPIANWPKLLQENEL